MAVDINDTPNRVRYTATAGQTAFSVPFQFLAATDLKIYQNGVLKTISTHYTVAGAGASSGTVTLVSGAALSDDILIVRDMPVQRIGDFPVSGPFDVASLNDQLDGLTMMVRDLETRSDRRSLRLAETDLPETLGALPTKANRASRALGFDADGNPQVGTPLLPAGWVDYQTAAAASATSAASSASTATTQAGTATTQASTATAQAGIATAQATIATTQAGLAATAKTGAETARDAASVNANVYASTAAGIAAVAVGNQFQVVSGDEIIRYRVDAGPVATEVARYPAADFVLRGKYAKETVGLVDTSVATTLYVTGWAYASGIPAKINGFVRRVRVKTNGSYPVRVFVANFNAGNLELVQYVTTKTNAAGSEVIDLTEDLPVTVGQYIGVFIEGGAPYYSVSSAAGHFAVTSGFVTKSGSASSLNSGVTLGIGFDIEATDRREWTRITDKSKEDQQDWEEATWVALGTSITQNQFYGEQASKRLGVDFVNYGTGGSTWCDGTGSGDGRIKKRALQVDPRANLVTIEGPINDFRLNEPLGTVRQTGASETMLGALYGMVQDLFEANPFRSVSVILSPPNMDSGFAGKWNTANGNGVYWDEVIEAVRKQGEWLGLEVITPKNMNGITAKWQQADLLHPDEKTGAIMLANEVAFRLSGMPKSRVSQCATPLVAFNTSTGQVTITCATAGATIRYTTDGSNPTTSSTTYSGAFIPADGDYEIRAIATATGFGRSPQRRARIVKATTSGLGVGTWNLRPAVVGDLTSTRGFVWSIEGGVNWSVDAEPAANTTSALWLASGSNNAVEFEVADLKAADFIPLVGIGTSGWMGLGYPRLASVYTSIRYALSTGIETGSSTFTALPMGSANEHSRRYRIARNGSSLIMFQNVYGTWSAITSGFDLSTISGATGYYETAQIGILLEAVITGTRVKNVLVGTLV